MPDLVCCSSKAAHGGKGRRRQADRKATRECFGEMDWSAVSVSYQCRQVNSIYGGLEPLSPNFAAGNGRNRDLLKEEHQLGKRMCDGFLEFAKRDT